MVYYVVTNWFPGSSSDEVAKVYLEERKKYPRDKSLLKVVAECIRSDEKGIKTMGVSEVKEGRFRRHQLIQSLKIFFFSLFTDS